MIIRTTAKSVYYPMAGQRAEVIRGSGRFRSIWCGSFVRRRTRGRRWPSRSQARFSPLTSHSDGAFRPLALARREGRIKLILEDPGGEPLDLLLGQPKDLWQSGSLPPVQNWCGT